MKKSRKTYKNYEDEIRKLNKKIEQMENKKREVMTVGSNKKMIKADADFGKKMEDWKVQKETMKTERVELMDQCKELQDMIKGINTTTSDSKEQVVGK